MAPKRQKKEEAHQETQETVLSSEQTLGASHVRMYNGGQGILLGFRVPKAWHRCPSRDKQCLSMPLLHADIVCCGKQDYFLVVGAGDTDEVRSGFSSLPRARSKRSRDRRDAKLWWFRRIVGKLSKLRIRWMWY